MVSSWAKEAKIGYSMINARAETVAIKPAIREAFSCLVPASGFYEWHTEGKERKQPYHFTCGNCGPMTFAGLWERWEKGSEPLETFTIIVGPANEQMQPFHDRVPVMLEPDDDWDLWLSADARLDESRVLLHP